MKICCISDTHGLHKYFTDQINAIEADVLVHAGDITSHGLESQVDAFVNWFDSFSHIPYRLFIGGNHDAALENKSAAMVSYLNQYKPGGRTFSKRLNGRTVYLENTSILVDGVKFYGSPYSPEFMNWHFMYRRRELAKALWYQVPADTDVLITHGPAYGKGDKVEGWGGGHVGCQDLLDRIQEIKPKLAINGHIHNGQGIYVEDNIQYVNAALLNEQYRPVNKPILIEI